MKPFIQDPKPSYPGIGISTYTTEGTLFIRDIFDGSPAALAGLHSGDEILDADGAPFQEIGSFTGKIGKTVQLRIRRPADAQPVTVPVTPKMLDTTTMFLDAMKASVEIVECDGVKVGDDAFHRIEEELDGLDMAAEQPGSRAPLRSDERH